MKNDEDIINTSMFKNNLIDRRDFFSVLLLSFIFLLIYALSLILIKPFVKVGILRINNFFSPINIPYIFFIFLVFFVIIIMIKFDWDSCVKYLVIFFSGYCTFIVLYPIFILNLNGFISAIFALILGLTVIILLIKYPKWFVLDISIIIISVVTIMVFSIIFSVLFIIFLLMILSIYDLYSVYKSKKMIEMVDSASELKIPITLIIPKIRNRLLNKDVKEKNVLLIGIGDIILPGFLILGIYYRADNCIFVVLSTVLGIIISLILLMIYVLKGRAQPCLPFLSLGAIIGYSISSLLLYGKLIHLNLSIFQM
jgi:presenilin-like A22 family membrane protease